MGEILGAFFRLVFEVIIQGIIYIIVEIFVEVIIMSIIHYFFGKTRWFSPLYIALAVFAGIQVYRSLQRLENPSANLYGFAATVLILSIAPLLHDRIQAFLGVSKQPESDRIP